VVALLGCGGDDSSNSNDGGASDGGGGSDSDAGPGGGPPATCQPTTTDGQTFYVATDGSDEADVDGSADNPWLTITHAVDSVPDGATVLVRAGTYTGRVRLRQQFETGIVIRSETPYAAKLRNSEVVVTSYYGKNIVLEGFDVAHDGPGAGGLVIQIQDLIDGDTTSGIVIRNNILHDSYNNDILKINNGATDVLVERNVFYNQTGSDEHIDVNSVERVVIQDNVFFNDFEASGRVNDDSTSSFIVVKDSNGDTDAFTGSRDIIVRRNVMANWQGNAGAAFILLGEDGNPFYEATEVVIENNLLIGNSSSEMRASFGIKGAADVDFRANTIVGDLPSNAYAFRFNREGENLVVDDIRIANNIWADTAGTMTDFSDTDPADVSNIALGNNLYWNAGNAIPEGASDAVNPSDDSAAVLGDPALPDPSAFVTPWWNEVSSSFGGGGASTCEVHRRLVEDYGTPAAGGAGVGQADPANLPAADILGSQRSGTSDIGAVQR
jgi:hypothetical protein